MTNEYAIGVLEDLRDAIIEDNELPAIVKKEVKRTFDHAVRAIKGIAVPQENAHFTIEMLYAINELAHRSWPDDDDMKEIDTAIRIAIMKLKSSVKSMFY